MASQANDHETDTTVVPAANTTTVQVQEEIAADSSDADSAFGEVSGSPGEICGADTMAGS